MKKQEKSLSLYVLLFVCMLFLFLFAAGGSVHKLIQQADKQMPSKPVIVLDAGHGGEDGGTQGNGLLEKDINLSIALTLENLLRANGFEVFMIRSTDTDVADHTLTTISERKKSDLKQRAQWVQEQKNCLLVSIHQNFFEQTKYHGTQVFYSVQNESSTQLAQDIQDSVHGLLQPDNEREIKPGEGIYLLDQVQAPAVIVECGFLSNADEAAKLNEPLYRQQMALCIFSGICDYVESESPAQQTGWFQTEQLPD